VGLVADVGCCDIEMGLGVFGILEMVCLIL